MSEMADSLAAALRTAADHTLGWYPDLEDEDCRQLAAAGLTWLQAELDRPETTAAVGGSLQRLSTADLNHGAALRYATAALDALRDRWRP